MKICTKCGGKPKPESEFSKSSRSRDGLQSKCKACERAYTAANSGKLNAYAAEYRAANREKVKAAQAKWAAANPGKLREKSARWRANNPDKVKALAVSGHGALLIRTHNYRARKRATNGKLSKDIAEKLFTLQRGKCACCRTPLGDNYHRDHHMPLALGGPNTDDNIQLLCPTCNLQKSAKHPIDFMQQRGFLL